MALKDRRYDSPLDQADGLSSTSGSTFTVDTKLTDKFYSPEDLVLKEGFGLDRTPGQLEPDMVRVPEPAAGNR